MYIDCSWYPLLFHPPRVVWWPATVLDHKSTRKQKHFIHCFTQSKEFVFSLQVMFFFTFFWGYYHNVSNPIWLIMPPEMIIKGWGIPMLNTAILLSSGAAVTWAHHATICAKDIMKKAPKWATVQRVECWQFFFVDCEEACCGCNFVRICAEVSDWIAWKNY